MSGTETKTESPTEGFDPRVVQELIDAFDGVSAIDAYDEEGEKFANFEGAIRDILSRLVQE